MKKSLLASAVFLVFNVAHAQTPGPAMVAPPSALTGPAVTTSVTTTTTAPGANTAVTATPNGAAVTTTTTATPVAAGMDVNPFTGVPKSEVETRRIEQDLKRQRQDTQSDDCCRQRIKKQQKTIDYPHIPASFWL